MFMHSKPVLVRASSNGMHRLGRGAVMLLLIVLAACSGSNGSPGLDTGSIAGTVVDANGAPIAGASVSTDPTSAATQTRLCGPKQVCLTCWNYSGIWWAV